MKHFKSKNTKRIQVNQVPITYTSKPITAWGGLASVVAKLLEVLEFRCWVETAIPIDERSNNAKGVYEKVLATFLTVLCGGSVSAIYRGGAMALKRSRRFLLFNGSPEPQAL